MAGQAHHFDEAFAKLTATISDQASGDGIIYLDEDIRKPFESTFAPTSNQALQDLARLFEGNDSCSLFLRLDGSAVYLVVSTVLQFPPCSLLTKTIYFFMDMLSLYADGRDAKDAFQISLDGSLLEKEVRKRQIYIFSQLIPRLKALLFEDDKHYKVKRLIAQLITSLCQGNARGWQELMNAQERRLFGTLMSQVDDYVLRVFIADIIRHLLANNYDIRELWEQSSEEVMDFPTSQELHPKTISKVLDSMSALDARQAFNETSRSWLYRIADVNIPDMQYHSAKSDTILIVDDNLALLVPDRDRGGTLFAIYEVPITQEIFLEKPQTSTKQASHLRISWRSTPGHVISRGKKEKVNDIHLQFARHSCRDEFCEAFDAAFKRRAQHSWLVSSQDKAKFMPQLHRMVVGTIDISDTEDEFGQAPHVQRKRVVDNSMERRPRSAQTISKQISSGSIIEQVPITSDVFGRASDDDQNMKKKPTGFSIKLRLGTATNSTLASPLMLLSSRDDYGGANDASSPLEVFDRRKNDEEAATRLHEAISVNPALNVPLHQNNDDDYAFFVGTASRANAPVNEELHAGLNHGRKRTYRDMNQTLQGGSLKPSKVNKNSIEMVKPTVKVPTSTSDTEVREVEPALEKKSQIVSSLSKSKTLKSLTKTLGPIDRPAASEQNDSMRTQILGGKKKSATNGSEKPPSRDVDWDEALHTDEHKNKRQKKDSMVNIKAPTKRPLRDVTNTGQEPSAPRRLVGRSKTSSSSQATTEKITVSPAASIPPARRSRRTMVKKAKSYAESSTSQDESTPEESLEEGEEERGTGLGKPPNLVQPGVHKTAQRQKQTTKCLSVKSPAVPLPQTETTTEASRKHGTTRPLVEVPSSDHEDEIVDSLPREVSLRSGGRQPKSDSAGSADTQAEEETEVLEDSHPRQNSEPKAHSTNADKSFGTKLSNMIATTPATVAGKTLQPPNTPFGDRKKFILNVNAARKSEPIPGKLAIPLAIPSAVQTDISSSKTLDVAGPVKFQQGLKRTASAVDTSIHSTTIRGTKSARISPGPFAGLQNEVSLQAEETRTSTPMEMAALGVLHKTLDREDEAVPDHAHSNSTGSISASNEHQIQEVSSGLENQGDSHQNQHDIHAVTSEARRSVKPVARSPSELVIDLETHLETPIPNAPGIDQVASSKSQAIHSKDTRTVNKSNPVSEPQYRLSTSSKDPRRHILRTSSHASVDHDRLVENASELDQTFMAAASSKTTIIHFDNIGPQNQGSPLKGKVFNMPKIRQQPAVTGNIPSLPLVDKDGDLQTRGTPTQAKVLKSNWPARLYVDNKSKTKEVHESSHSRSTSKEQRPDLFDEDYPHDLVGDAIFDNILQDSVVPSFPTELVNKTNSFSRRSDRAGQPRQISPLASYTQSFVFEKNASTEPEQTGRFGQPEFSGSSLETPVYISSTHTTSETDPEEEPLHEVHAVHATVKAKTTSDDSKHREVRKFLKESNDRNTVPLTSLMREEDQRAATNRLGKTPQSEQASEPVNKRLLPTNSTTWSVAMSAAQDSKLFSLNTTARRIFSKENMSKVLSSTTAMSKPGGFELFESSKSVNEVRTKPKTGGIGTTTHDWPSIAKLPPPAIPVQNLNQRAQQDLANPTAPGLKNATLNERGEAANQITNKLNIVRVRRQQLSSDKKDGTNFSEPALPVNTPKAFVQQLHAPRSAVSTTSAFHDTEQTQDFLPDDSDFAETTLVGQPHSHQSMRLQISQQPSGHEALSSSMSPKSEAVRPTTIQHRQQRSNCMQPTSIFASTAQRMVLDIIQDIAARVDVEEKLAVAQVENYRTGSLEIAKDLRCNSISRLDYDATKLATILRGQRQLVAEAKLQLSEKSSLATGREQVSDHVEQHRFGVLAMLDDVQH